MHPVTSGSRGWRLTGPPKANRFIFTRGRLVSLLCLSLPFRCSRISLRVPRFSRFPPFAVSPISLFSFRSLVVHTRRT